MSIRKRLTAFAVSTAMFITLLPAAAFAHEGSYKIYKGTFTVHDYASGKSEKDVYYYSDQYFSTPGTQMHEHLRTMSLSLSIVKDNEKTGILSSLGFGDIEQQDMDTSTADTIGTIIASKKTVDDEDLIVVVPRSLSYGNEWINNLIVGISGDAEGFSSASKKVYDRIVAYEKDHDLKGAKIWITGYSRGGGIADLTGKLINENLDELGITKGDLYDYAFAAPNTSSEACGYENIHDITDPDDVIARMMPEGWGMTKAGTEYMIPGEGQKIMPKQLSFSAPFITDKTVQDYDPETGTYGPSHPADPVYTAEFLDKFVKLLSDNVSREMYNAVRTVLPAFVNEVRASYEDDGAMLEFLKDTFSGVTSDFDVLGNLITLIATSEDSDSYKQAYANIGPMIENLINKSPSKDKVTAEQIESTKKALPVVLKLFLSAIRSDFKATQGETLVTFAGNIQSIISNHFPTVCFQKLTKLDSYYTEKVDVDPGKLYYFGKQYENGEYDTMKKLGVPDADIELIKNGYDVEYRMLYNEIKQEDVAEKDVEAVEDVIGAEPDLIMYCSTTLTRKQTFGETEILVNDNSYNASFRCVPGEDERLYNQGQYYFINYEDGKATALDAKFSFNEKRELVIEYTSTKRGTYALAYVSTDPAESMRIYGKDRYETSRKIADKFSLTDDAKGFDSVIVASGADFADALSAAYLAKTANAPVLLTNNNDPESTADYIKQNMDAGNTVYIIGGEGAISSRLDKLLTTSSDKQYEVKRLAGKDRFETNLEVLKQAGADEGEMLFASGADFADAISASAVGKPLMLTAASGLSQAQKDYLKGIKTENAVIIGGTAAVSETAEKQIKDIYTKTERIGGKDRYETSELVANKYFKGTATVVLASGASFADGLSGAPLAMHYEAPVLLVSNTQFEAAQRFANEQGVKKSVTLGGPTIISDETIEKIVPAEEMEKLDS